MDIKEFANRLHSPEERAEKAKVLVGKLIDTARDYFVNEVEEPWTAAEALLVSAQAMEAAYQSAAVLSVKYIPCE